MVRQIVTQAVNILLKQLGITYYVWKLLLTTILEVIDKSYKSNFC